MYLYLTISAKYVLILSTKAVDHVNNMGNRRMMEPQPAFLSPLVRLSQSGTLSQAWHHAQHTPGHIYVSIHCIYMYLPEKLKSHRILTTWTEPDQIRDNCV